MNKKAFSMIEILVVVLIISVLASITIPLYKRNVYRTKYSTLMPIAKAAVEANEVYYVVNNNYSTNPHELHVQIPGNTNSYVMQLVDDDQGSYASLTRPDLPNNKYILYQKFSNNFPMEAHCEAAVDDTDANWLCQKGLKGNLIEGSLTPNFNTYIISGVGNGQMPATLSQVLANIKCEENENSGSKTCEVIINDYNSITKVSCKNKNNPTTCSYVTYNQDGSQSTCYASAANYVDGECIAHKKGSYRKDYDENGILTEYLCNQYTEGSGCYALGQEQYDANGTHIAAQNRYCVEWNSRGECVEFKQGTGNDHIAVFTDGHKMWVRADCQDIDVNGVCTSYKGGRVEEWDFDENGNTAVYYDNTCTSMSMDYVCSAYSKYKTTTYTYNDDGRIENTCESSVGANTNCKNITTKTYNAAGKQTDGVSYSCGTWDSNGNCTKYKSSETHSFTYTANNKETSHVKTKCSSYDSQNNCTQYAPIASSYNAYTDDGKTQTSKTTTICNQYTGTTCTGGWTVTTTPYVNGKENTAGQTVNSNCQNVNMTTGQCLD